MSWEPVHRYPTVLDANSSREVEAILLGTADPIQVGMRRVGDDSDDDVAS